MITNKDHPNQHEKSHKLCNEWKWGSYLLMNLMETETTTRSEFPNEGKAIVEQILV